MKVIVKNLSDGHLDVFAKSKQNHGYTIKTIGPREGTEYEFEAGDDLVVLEHGRVDEIEAVGPGVDGNEEQQEDSQ